MMMVMLRLLLHWHCTSDASGINNYVNQRRRHLYDDANDHIDDVSKLLATTFSTASYSSADEEAIPDETVRKSSSCIINSSSSGGIEPSVVVHGSRIISLKEWWFRKVDIKKLGNSLYDNLFSWVLS
jgi:hypothetical protein